MVMFMGCASAGRNNSHALRSLTLIRLFSGLSSPLRPSIQTASAQARFRKHILRARRRMAPSTTDNAAQRPLRIFARYLSPASSSTLPLLTKHTYPRFLSHSHSHVVTPDSRVHLTCYPLFFFFWR